MSSIVGIKGQIVLDRTIRQKLGVGPGWHAVQKWVDDHIEIRLLPPEHNESLRGTLKKHLAPSSQVSEDDWDEAISADIGEEFKQQVSS